MEKKALPISFIIVNFQSRKLLGQTIASVQKLESLPEEIIIINNDSTPLEGFSASAVPIRIIEAGRNLGFGAAVNLGAKTARGKYLFLLNPDAQIIASPFGEALREFEKDSCLAVLGARLVDAAGQTQPWIAGKEITLGRLIANKLKLSAKKPNSQKLLVDWVSGAGMLMRKDFFDQIGGFDEKIFLYYEDIDLCRRAQNSGFRILYFPTLVIQHLGGGSFQNQKEQKRYYRQSQAYYFQKHLGKFQSTLIRLMRFIF